MKNDVRNTRPTGKVASGGNKAPFHSVTQPEPDTEHGAPEARTRKSESSVTAGHHVTNDGATAPEPAKGLHLAKHRADDTHVHADTPEAKARETFVKAERERKDEKTTSPSGRKSLKELLTR